MNSREAALLSVNNNMTKIMAGINFVAAEEGFSASYDIEDWTEEMVIEVSQELRNLGYKVEIVDDEIVVYWGISHTKTQDYSNLGGYPN